LEVEAAVVTSWRVIFVMPSQIIAKLIGFTMDDDTIVVVDMGHEIVHTLQVYDHPSQQFHTLGIIAAAILLWIWGFNVNTKIYAKIIEDVGEDDDFNSGAWVSATNYVMAFGGTVTGCLGDIDNILKKGKLDHIVAIVKSCSPNMLGDLNVTLKDISGTIPGIIHHKVMDEGGYGKDITVGAVMILKNVSVFNPKPSEHYLNITMRNVVEVFHKYTVLGSSTG
nr:transposase, MuDR, MULE transposase domain protein [Tanacetum cinerariifolium]